MNASLFTKTALQRERISNPAILAAPSYDKEFGLFDSVFHEVSNAIAIVSRQPENHAPLILDINHHFELITGYRLDDISGQNLYDFLAMSQSAPHRQTIEDALKSRQAVVLFCPWKNKDGKIIDMDMTLRPFSSDDQDSKFICILRQNNDESQKRNDAAREVKKNLLAAMHHNFKTPLNGILGYSEVIMSEMLGPIKQESYKNYAQDIHGAGKDLLHLIDNLLDLKELETAEFTLNEEIFPLEGMVSECEKKLSRAAEKAKVSLSHTINMNAKNLRGDKSRLQQALHSLLLNALKFTPPGGNIQITATAGADGSCLICCTDNGAGMSTQQLAKIFCPDTHLTNIYSSPTQGIGFGLTYVKQLIEKHEGTISVISSREIGTTVTLLLPAERLS